MKTEERHHLHENDLATAMNRGLQRVEPFAKQIGIAVLVVVLLVVAIAIWFNRSGSVSEEGWAPFMQASAADDFATVADDFAGTAAGRWARLRAGQEYLNEGLRSATSDRKTSEDRLDQAEKAFLDVLDSRDSTSPIRERALYGLALAREARITTDPQPAIEAYQEYLEQYPEGTYSVLAKSRITALQTDEAREFYAWLASQPRNPEDRPQPKELVAREQSRTDLPVLPGDDDPPAIQRNPDRPPSPRLPGPVDSESADAGDALPFPETAPELPMLDDEAPPTEGPMLPGSGN